MKDYLDRKSGIPFYRQLKKILLDKIKNNEFKDGKLYSEPELAKKYGITVSTARKALDELKNEGIIYKVVGRGTFIKKRKFQVDLSNFLIFGKMLKEKGFDEVITVLDKEKLRFNTDFFNGHDIKGYKNDILNIRRVRYIDGEPIAIENFFFNYDKCSPIEDNINEPHLYSFMSEEIGINFAKVEEYLEPVIIRKEESELLEVKKGSPALLLVELIYDHTDTWILFSKTIIKGDICRYYLRVK